MSENLVDVPTADGKTVQLPEGTPIVIQGDLLAAVRDGGFVWWSERHNTASWSLKMWNEFSTKGAVQAFQPIDFPPPKVELPEGIGAVMVNIYHSVYLTRTSATVWRSSRGKEYSNKEATEFLEYGWRVLSEGVVANNA